MSRCPLLRVMKPTPPRGIPGSPKEDDLDKLRSDTSGASAAVCVQVCAGAPAASWWTLFPSPHAAVLLIDNNLVLNIQSVDFYPQSDEGVLCGITHTQHHNWKRLGEVWG